MPHVIIKIWPGPTEEEKALLAQRISETIVTTLNSKETSVSVAIEEVEKELWGKEVYKKDIMDQQDIVYKMPGYVMEIND